MNEQTKYSTYIQKNIIGLKKEKYFNTHYLEGIMPYEVQQTPCV